MDFPADFPRTSRHRHTPTRTAVGPATSWRRCSPPPSAYPSAGGRIVEVLGRSFVWVPAAQRRRPAQRPARPAHGGDRRPGLRPGLQLRGAVPPGRRRPHVVHRRARRGVRARSAPAGGHRRQPRRRGRHPAAPGRGGRAVPRRAHPAGRARHRRPGPALRARLAGRPGRLPRRGRPPSSPRTGVVRTRPPLPRRRSRRPTRSCSSASNSPTGRATCAPCPWTPSAGPSAAPASRWPVNLVLLDVAQDPVGDWMREQRPALLPAERVTPAGAPRPAREPRGDSARPKPWSDPAPGPGPSALKLFPNTALREGAVQR